MFSMSDRYPAFWSYHSLCLNGPLLHKESLHSIDSYWNSLACLGYLPVCGSMFSETMRVTDRGAWAGRHRVAASRTTAATSLNT